MAVPASQTHVTHLHEPENSLAVKAQRCPRCDGSGWVKIFTPWGCPTSTRCDCRAKLAPDVDERRQ